MIVVDQSLFIQIINFLLLIFILNIILYRPIRNILAQRKEKVDRLGQSIEKFKNDAIEKGKAFDEGIKNVRTKGMKEKDALLQEAASEEKAIIEKINRKAQADLEQIRAKIGKETEKVRESLQKEVDDFASAICEKILGRAVK